VARGLMATHRKITELAAQMLQIRLRELPGLETRQPDNLRALTQAYLMLGLCYWWTEQVEPAHRYWRTCLETGQRFLDGYLAQGGSPHPHWEAEYVRNAAMVANFLGEEQRAGALMAQAEMLAAGLLPGLERPLYPEQTADRYGEYPNIRAYCLVRLRRLTGFQAATYSRQWPDAKEEEPAWRPADIFDLFHTTEVCMAKAKANGDEVFDVQKMQLPLMRALARYLQTPGPGLQKEAQKALVEYLGKINHLGHFWTNLPLALDLQTAFPDIFTPVLPPARPR
jgi:hypothetical protein